jgi:hypothetical protein
MFLEIARAFAAFLRILFILCETFLLMVKMV